MSERDDGALLGPFALMIAWPQWGEGVWAATKALLDHTVLPKPAHEVAILATGAHFHVSYEIYAHERVAAGTDLSASKIATIVAGQRPADLAAEQVAANAVISSLLRGPVRTRPTPPRETPSRRRVLRSWSTWSPAGARCR